MAHWTELTIDRVNKLEVDNRFSMLKWCKSTQDYLGSEVICELIQSETEHYHIKIDEELSSKKFNDFLNKLFNETPYLELTVLNGKIFSPLLKLEIKYA